MDRRPVVFRFQRLGAVRRLASRLQARALYQTEVIPVWSCLVVQMVQGLQIDTDHWHHLNLLFGLLFGFAAADRMAGIVRVRGSAAERRLDDGSFEM